MVRLAVGELLAYSDGDEGGEHDPRENAGPEAWLGPFHELVQLDLSGVEMVVLSACNTARGENQVGEGIVGFTWALFAAGCPTQIVSQWSVNDESTGILMGRFYKDLKAGKPKAEALRQAALALKNDGKHSHPYYWAPFILVGDGR